MNLRNIMIRAWELRKEKHYTMGTALRLAWAEAKGCKAYAFHIEDVRPQITAFIVNLIAHITDEHDAHKLDALKSALLAPIDRAGIAVLDGKTVGLCKYAVRNA